MSDEIRAMPSFYIENILQKNNTSFHLSGDTESEGPLPRAPHPPPDGQQVGEIFPGVSPGGEEDVFICDQNLSVERCSRDALCVGDGGDGGDLHDNGSSGQPETLHDNNNGPLTLPDDRKQDADVGAGDDGKKRPRTAFSAEQVRSLEQEFQRSKYLSVSKRTDMSRQLGLTEQQIKIWFQNRRTKWKRKYTNNLEILAQQHYLRMGLLPSYPLQPGGGAAGGKPSGQYGGMFSGVRPAFPTPSPTVRLYPSFGGHPLPRM